MAIGPRKIASDPAETRKAAGRNIRLEQLEQSFAALLAALPELDLKALGALAENARAYPANAYPKLLEKLASADPAAGALAFITLRECGDQEIQDTLNAAIFDGGCPEALKVRANEILIELGNPMDPDVLEMSAPNAEKLAAASPWRALREAQAGDIAAAAATIGRFTPPVRAILIHQLSRKGAQTLTALAEAMFNQLARDESDALAMISALGQSGDERAVPLLTRLAELPGREIQKNAKRAIFAITGVAAPAAPAAEPAPPAPAEAGLPARQAGLPIHRACVGRTRDNSAAIVAVAREYPNGRLNALIVIIDFYKRGIRDARHWINMSRGDFRRHAQERFAIKIADAPLDECRNAVARGIRVAQEVGAVIPFDLQTGKEILGDVAAAVAAISAPFLCAWCGAPLDEESVARIKKVAAYDIPVETRCAPCRQAEKKT